MFTTAQGRPTSPAPSPRSSARPASAASASTTSGTRPPPCSWNGASNSSSSKELLGHAHIGVTATVYAHVRLRLQRDAIDALGTMLNGRAIIEAANGDGEELPPCAALVR
ncbi:integrase [Streptomyces halstedii]|nr:integrase [Streptomyces griseolus]